MATTRPAFFPKTESIQAYSTDNHNDLPHRPKETSPILDPLSSTAPLRDYDLDLFRKGFHRANSSDGSSDGSSPAGSPPSEFPDPYLMPMLTQNERLRLTMLWYYTKGITEDQKLLQRIQEKVNLVKEFMGWEFALCGLLDNDVYERLATAGLPLAILPRRESTCAHTVQQNPGSVLLFNDMGNDWRFKNSPHVDKGGLRSYAGTQLRCRTDDGEEVAFGSVCVASNTAGLTLSTAQQDVLVRFADMIVMEIINHCRWSRQRQQQRMNDLLARASAEPNIDRIEEEIMSITKELYPDADVRIVAPIDNHIRLSAEQNIPLPDTKADSGIWEAGELLDNIILTMNHQKLTATQFVRAIYVSYWDQSATRMLLVASTDVRLIFDDIDIWFVQRCASVLSNMSQQRSLREALQVKDEFLRGVTHQLRTPIHGVLGSVDLLTEELAARGLPDIATLTNGTEKHTGTLNTSEVLRTIRNSGQELMSTVNNIIKLHRWAETSGPDRTAGVVGLAELEAQIVDDVLSVVPDDTSAMIRFMFDNQLPADITGIMTDTLLLRECLQSVVLNALQATSAGDVVVTVSTPEDRSVLIFDVEDTGCGIPPRDQQRIFETYQKSDIHTRGVGLGLTLACRMAISMNGEIKLVSSTEGEGSHFRAVFQTPAFVCGTRQTNGEDHTTAGATNGPTEFHIINPLPTTNVLEHLRSFLNRAGLRETTTPGQSIFYVRYVANRAKFEDALSQTVKGNVGFCLIPAGEMIADLRALYPRITFATGPFTTKRLNEILAHVRQISDSYIAESPSRATNPNSEFDKRRSSTPVSSTERKSGEPLVPFSLLVDDNLVNLKILRMYCDKRRYPYAPALDGLEAIDAYAKAAETNPVKLVLLDLQMPKCHGLQACTKIRALEQARGMEPAVIFILTGQDSPNDKEQAFAAGADEFFVKPVSFKVLDRSIAKYFYDQP